MDNKLYLTIYVPVDRVTGKPIDDKIGYTDKEKAIKETGNKYYLCEIKVEVKVD
jgi:hypothetical protein